MQENEMLTAKKTKTATRRRKVRQAGVNRRRRQADRGRSWEKQRGVTRRQEDKKRLKGLIKRGDDNKRKNEELERKGVEEGWLNVAS